MSLPTRITLAAAALSALCGCAASAPPDDQAPAAQPSQPHERAGTTATGFMAGAAEAMLSLPIGTPLAAYTGRLEMFHPAPDGRTSQYCTEFDPSFGVQTRIPIKVIWLQNGNQNVVLVKVDIGYAFDGVLFSLQDAITDATGIDVTDKVVFSTSHSHSSYGDFSNDPALYLGSDQFNTEIFTRLIEQVTGVAETALADLAPAAIGVGFDPDFDPIGVDNIFRDRREENDDLVGVDGQTLGHGYKDPRLTLVRIDHSQGTADPGDDTPLALIHSFGMHGTIMGEDNALTSVEGSGHIDLKVQEQFDRQVVVMHLQGAGGDQSPAGRQNDFARMESLGELAAPKILSLYNATTTATGEVSLELLTRSVKQVRDEMRITRQGTVNYYYTPYTPEYQGDDIIYNADGTVASPIDEFNTENGAALCDGSEDMQIISKLWGWPTQVAPYNTCGNAEEILEVMRKPIFEFDLDWVTAPLQTAQSTVISALKLGPVPIYSTDGSSSQDNLVVGFFPGEPVSLYSATFRKELEDVYGYKNTVTVGYSNDHEGYLLTLEDWVKGGYEPEINQWGPIQGEYLLEQLVELAGQFGTNDPSVPATSIPHPEYDYFPLEPAVPDVTPNAGHVPTRMPAYLYTWDGVMPSSPQPDLEVPRVSGIATFLWEGGDPIVDLPSVTLERETSPGSGVFETVLHPSGRPWSDAGDEILLTYTPNPLKDVGPQTHYWLATFQAVTDEPDRAHSAGLPLGNYRFRVAGSAVVESGGSYPWQTVPYSVVSAPFAVVALNSIVVTPTYSGGTLSLTASYPAVSRGYRLIDMNAGDEKEISPLNQGSNSTVTGAVSIYSDLGSLIWQNTSTPFTTNTGYSSATLSVPALSAGSYQVQVSDVFGNYGRGQLLVN